MDKQAQENIYVDNVILSTKATPEALQILIEVRLIFHHAKMNLRAFISNDSSKNDAFREENKFCRTQLKVAEIWCDTLRMLSSFPPYSYQQQNLQILF